MFSNSDSFFNPSAMFPHPHLSSKEPPESGSSECVRDVLCSSGSDWQGAPELLSDLQGNEEEAFTFGAKLTALCSQPSQGRAEF